MSLTTSQIISAVESQYPGRWQAPDIATMVVFLCGFIVLAIGLLRIGWLIEFIPAPAVSGFMTGSAIKILAGQVPGLMRIDVPSKVASVVTYDDERRTSRDEAPRKDIDIEARHTQSSSSSSISEGASESTSLLTEATPFFHFDLVAALRAVETSDSQLRLYLYETLSIKKVKSDR
jgi:Sulfate permease family